MPYGKRETSSTGMYHTTSRGVGQQNIFMDKQDREQFMETLAMVSVKCGVVVLVHSLMSNHFHLVLKEGSPLAISKALQILKSVYCRYFNRRYGRRGTLYEERFFSSPVEREDYFVRLMRYVCQNPLKVGEGFEWTGFEQLAKPVEGGWPKSFAGRRIGAGEGSREGELQKMKTMSRKAWKVLVSGKSKELKLVGSKKESLGNGEHLSRVSRKGCHAMDGLVPGQLVRMVLAAEISPYANRRTFASFIRKGMKEDMSDATIEKYALEGPMRQYKTDVEAEEIVREMIPNIEKFAACPWDYKKTIEFILDKKVSLSQMSRITAVGRETLRRILIGG
jgi:REP element-mobilizing transposase RayT